MGLIYEEFVKFNYTQYTAWCKSRNQSFACGKMAMCKHICLYTRQLQPSIIKSVIDMPVFHLDKTEENVTKTFRFPKGLAEQLEQLAQEKNISMNRLVIQCCQFTLEHLARD